MSANPLLPVLHALSPNHHWPETINDAFVRVVSLTTSHFLFLTRELVTAEEQASTSPVGLVPFDKRADVQVMRLASEAGHDARRIMRTARIQHTGQVGAALLDVLTATLMYRAADPSSDHAPAARHGKTLVNRALAVADWIAAAQLHGNNLTFSVAARIVGDQLPPPWRWERRPDTEDETGPLFVIARPFSEGRGRELITVTGPPTQPIQISHQHNGAEDTSTSLSWPELCHHMARTLSASSATKPAETTPPHA